MRVIAGQLRGRRLTTPTGLDTRPVTDRVKETLFNIIGSRFGLPGSLPALHALDLFAGTGGLGIEALSRGAASCLFIEHDRRCVRVLRKNIAHLGLEPASRISSENAWTMRVPPAGEAGYGLVFLDPPYAAARDLLRVVDVLERLAPQLATDAVVIFRHEWRTTFPVAALHALQRVDEREVGTMRLWFFSPAQAAAPDAAASPSESPAGERREVHQVSEARFDNERPREEP